MQEINITRFLSHFLFLIILNSCANIVAPSGGEKDVNAPKTQDITVLEKSNLKIIEFKFDEYIQLNQWEKNFYISPPLKNIIKKEIKGKNLVLTIKDSLNSNITYYISLNYCIKDNNEGNVLEKLDYLYSFSKKPDSLSIRGKLIDGFSLNPEKNSWVMLFNYKTNDSLLFKQKPNYVAKTNENGFFYFPNLKDENYKVIALNDVDFVYDNKEKIAFGDSLLNAKKDSFITLYSFRPEDIDTINNIIDTTKEPNITLDSINKNESQLLGSLLISTNYNSSCIFQLLQNDKIIYSNSFNTMPFSINNITPGKYNLKFIADYNQDKIWNTGDWNKKTQPEKVKKYPNEIIIRGNWDLEIEWIIEE
tara:strand:+ start:269 stop:1357 length:1089 start_codon:yes stop_codon:yes gene_type:complete